MKNFFFTTQAIPSRFIWRGGEQYKRNEIVIHNLNIQEAYELAKSTKNSEDLAQLAENEELAVVVAVIHNSNTSSLVLERLWNENRGNEKKAFMIQKNLAQEPHTPNFILSQLLKLKKPILNLLIAQNPNTLESDLFLLAHDPEEVVRIHVAMNTRISKRIVDVLEKDTSLAVKQFLHSFASFRNLEQMEEALIEEKEKMGKYIPLKMWNKNNVVEEVNRVIEEPEYDEKVA